MPVSDHNGHPGAHDELEQLVALVPIFEGLNDEELHEVAHRVRPRNYRRGEQLYGAGEHNPHLMIIHTGRVKVYRISESGHEQLIRLLGPGDFLGETTFINQAATDHFAMTLEESEICSLHRDDFRNQLMRYPTVAFKVLETLSHRLERTEYQVSSLTGDDAERRIAAYLLELAPSGGAGEIQLPMAKRDVASYLGTTPETLSRKLAQIDAAGLIRLGRNRRIELLDPVALRQL